MTDEQFAAKVWPGIPLEEALYRCRNPYSWRADLFVTGPVSRLHVPTDDGTESAHERSLAWDDEFWQRAELSS
jgi:hypothetical protein